MKIIRFRGGLGNQLFDAALYLVLRQYADDVCADLTEFVQVSPHDGYEVERVFDIDLQKATRSQIRKIADYSPVPFKGFIGNYLLAKQWQWQEKKIERRGAKPTHFMEAAFNDMPGQSAIKQMLDMGDIYLDGYWRSSKYYEGFDFVKGFSFSKSIIEEYRSEAGRLKQEESCAIHVRQGDYVGTEWERCGVSYYSDAIKTILDKVPDVIFYVFSDDIDRAQDLLHRAAPGIEFEVLPNRGVTGAGDDLYLMSRCRHRIMANSTYSEWGYLLSEEKGGVTVGPSIISDEIQARTDGELIWLEVQ